ncbi:MAG: sucrose phosphorylase [Bacteroidales bacterium]|nr:sucrose phosphorylase [Bacteroidales bacterium]
MPVKNKVQLITYPDSLGGTIKTLHMVLKKHFDGLFQGGIHLLPPYPSSGDRGFAPVSYFEIAPEFGDWQDVKALGEEYDLLLDFMVNHISKASPYVQDFLKNGRRSEYADMFLTLDKIWPDGEPVQQDIDRMFLRRKVPYSTFSVTESGTKEKLWTTFGKTDPSEQIDLDIQAAITRTFFKEVFTFFSKNNIRIVRLDAVGYVIKKLGSSCFFVEPDIYRFLDEIKDLADKLNIELLPEVHAQINTQYKLSESGFWIYDFVLPYYILEAVLFHRSDRLADYLKTRPHRQFTMLDCHDGIPVKPDLDDLVSSADARKVVDVCVERGANLSLIYADEHKSPDGFDVHQVRCTIYSALGENDDAYVQARALQLFTPGIPQVYYVGLLAGKNDVDRVARTGEGREINRHNYTQKEIENTVKQDIVQRLIRLIQFRDTHPSFDGSFSVQKQKEYEIVLKWELDKRYSILTANLETHQSSVTCNDEHGNAVTQII